MPNRRRPSTDAIRPLLRRIGLDEREIEIYLALLALKMARVRDIALAAKQSRTNAYNVLRDLQGRGLVSSIERGNVLHFVAEHPSKLLAYLADRSRELAELDPLVRSVVPTLASLSRPLPGQPRVTMLTGREGMLRIYGEAIEQEYRAFMNAEKLFEVFPENLPHLVLGKHARLRGRDLIVDNAAAAKALRDFPPNPNEGYDARLLPRDMSYPAEAIVFGDVVALFAYDDEKTTVRIENASIAALFRSLFDGLWAVGRPAKKK